MTFVSGLVRFSAFNRKLVDVCQTLIALVMMKVKKRPENRMLARIFAREATENYIIKIF
jgi:hypothetical protein